MPRPPAVLPRPRPAASGRVAPAEAAACRPGRSAVRDPRARKDVCSGCVSRIAPLRVWPHRLQFLGSLAADENRRADDLAWRRRRPALRISDERHVPRLDHLERELIELPSAPELPRLEPRVLQAPFRELTPGPVRSRLVRGRRGQPRTDDVDEVAKRRGHARPLAAFADDLVDHRLVNRLLRRRSRGQQEYREAGGEQQSRAHGEG